MVGGWDRTPPEPGKNLSVAALMSLWIVVMSATLERDTWRESWEYLSVATLLALRIVESMSTGHSSRTGNMSRHHPRKATLLKPWIQANPTTLCWEQIARHVFGDDFTVATLLALRIVESMSTRHSSQTGNMSRHHPRKATLLKARIIASPTTLSWKQIARHVFGDDFTVATLLIERVVALSFAAQPFALDASGNHMTFAASLRFTVVQGVTATFGHAFAEWGQAPQNDAVTTARFD